MSSQLLWDLHAEHLPLAPCVQMLHIIRELGLDPTARCLSAYKQVVCQCVYSLCGKIARLYFVPTKNILETLLSLSQLYVRALVAI